MSVASHIPLLITLDSRCLRVSIASRISGTKCALSRLARRTKGEMSVRRLSGTSINVRSDARSSPPANGFSRLPQKRRFILLPLRTAIYLSGLPAGLTDVYRISTVCSPPRDNTDPWTNCCSGQLSPVNDVSERHRVIGENPWKSLTNREPKSEFAAED